MSVKKVIVGILVGLTSGTVFGHGTFQALSFTENKGQLDSKVQFHCKLHIGDLYLEKNAFTFDMFSARELDFYYDFAHNRKNEPPTTDGILNKHAYKMTFAGANPNVLVSSSNKMEGYKNYFIGNDPSKWASKAYSFNQVSYTNLYPNIDLEMYASVSQLKYDIIVRKGGDATQIKVDYSGVKALKIDEKGNLVVLLSNGEVKETKPYAYQQKNGKEVLVPCMYKLTGNQVSYFFPEGFNRDADLVIDPILVFSSLTGSSADNWGFTATYDSQGNVYGGGMAFANGYPTTSGAYQTTFAGSRDIAISKFTASGNTLLFSTYLGGSAADVPHSLVNDAQDNLIVMGSTGSSNFPTTPGCYDATFNGGVNFTASNGVPYGSGADAIISKFNPTGTALIGSTYMGGTGNDGINQSIVFNYSDEARGEVVVDDQDDIYVTCSSRSTNFPTTAGSHSLTNAGNQDAVVFKLNATLTTLMWSTYYGGSGNDAGYSIRVAPNGNVYICGGTASTNLPMPLGGLSTTYGGGTYDGFIAAFNGVNGALLHATYTGTGSYDQAFILEVDAMGEVFTVGQTKGAYPVVNAAYSVAGSAQFIHKMNGTLSATTYSTVFGDGANTSVDISLTAFLVDNCGNVYVAGWGGNTNNEGTTNGLPVTANAIKTTTDGSDFYFFVMEKNATGLLYGSYFGSNSVAEHVDGGTSRFDKQGTIYQAACAGCGGGNSFPTTPGVWSTTNGSSNCNLGVVKIALDFQGVSAEANVPPDIFLCASPFTVDFTGNPNPTPHVFWDFGDGIGTSTQNNPSYTYNAVGTYDVMFVAIDSASCNIADTAFFQVTLQQPEVLTADFSFPTIDPCTSLDSVLVSLAFTGTGADSIVWHMGNGVIITGQTSVDYYYTQQGIYEVVMYAYDNVCDNEAFFTETFDYTYTITTANAVAPPDTAFCGPPPYNMNFTATSNTPQHYWDFGDGTGNSSQANPGYIYTAPGQYTIMYVAIDPASCNGADTVYFSVDISQAEVLTAEFTLPTVAPCDTPDSILVSLQFTGTGADLIEWNMGDGTTFTNVNSVDYYYSVQGTYPITMMAHDFYCNVSVEVTDTVYFYVSYSEAQAQVPEDIFLCATPLAVPFSAGSNPPPSSYWDFGDGVGNSTIHNPVYTYTSPGQYTVMYVAIDPTTCNIADTVYFNVSLQLAQAFSASLNFTPPPPCGMDSMLVSLAFTGTGADSIVWNMGNGDVFNGNSIDYYYTVPGTYTVSMTAYDNACDNVQTISNEVVFAGPVVSMANVPNVFTPNNDGDNDVLKILSIDGSAEYSMVIFNRWGVKVFETDDSTVMWDGTTRNGSKAADGVYFYEVRYTDICTTEEKIKTGYVHLYR
jgi:gliding motility-associated-like protein